MAEFREGEKAPAFSLKDKDKNSVKLSSIDAQYTVVYFYPKDDTPGCTIEAKDFSAYLKQFKKLDTEVIGISGGDESSKEKFCNKHKLTVTLVSDPDFKVSTKYNAYGDKTFMGKKGKGIFRKTFILDKDKKVMKIYDKVKAEGHAEEVIEYIKSLLKDK